VRVAPEGAGAANPAFDVTPRELVSAIVTDERTIKPAAPGDRVDSGGCHTPSSPLAARFEPRAAF
jgi:hypothetical protein